jgi:hypothetical protein
MELTKPPLADMMSSDFPLQSPSMHALSRAASSDVHLRSTQSLYG